MEFTTRTKATLTIPNQLPFLPMAISFVRQNASMRGFEEKQMNSIELATEEAVSNVIRHAFRPDEKAEFSISCEQAPRGLKIIVKDKGTPFDPSILPEYNPASADDPQQGLGWYLMRQSMDEVIFQNLGPEGKEIHLIKYLYGEEQEEENTAPVVETDTASEPKRETIPFKVRKAKPEDAAAIARCAYDAYGYSYKEYVYYPERLGKMIADRNIISIVAVTKEEQETIISHAALVIEEPAEKIGEMGMAFTQKAFQGQGCGKKIGVFLVKEVLTNRMRGWFAYATTSHLYSQITAYKTGARTSCILIGDAPASRKNLNFSALPERGSRVYMFLNTQIAAHLKLQFRKKKIYAPEHHKEMIEKIYKNLNEKVNLLKADKPSNELKGQAPLIDTFTKPGRQSAKIKVRAYGEGIVHQIQRLVKKLCIEKYEVINLHLYLHDPLTGVMCKEFEALGFFFIGIMPGAKSGDQLVLLYLNNILTNYDNIQLHSDFSKELLGYIKEQDPVLKSIEE